VQALDEDHPRPREDVEGWPAVRSFRSTHVLPIPGSGGVRMKYGPGESLWQYAGDDQGGDERRRRTSAACRARRSRTIRLGGGEQPCRARSRGGSARRAEGAEHTEARFTDPSAEADLGGTAVLVNEGKG